MEDSCREYSYSKNEETRLKIFQFSERWDSVENFSPWNNTTSWKFLHWKPTSTGSLPSLPHARVSISFLLPWGTPGAKVPSARHLAAWWQGWTVLGGRSSSSSPLLVPKGQSWSTCVEAALGHMEVLYHSAAFHDCCLPTDKSSSLCPCAQWKAFQIACAVNFISVAGLLVSLPTQNEQPDSWKLIRRRARSGACQRPVACKQPLPELCQSTSVHCREDFFDAPDRYLRQDSTYILHYLSERDRKWVIRKRGGVGSALLTLVVKRWAWRLLGGLGEATVTGPGSLRRARLVSLQPSSTHGRHAEDC